MSLRLRSLGYIPIYFIKVKTNYTMEYHIREIDYENDIDEIITLLNKSFSSFHNKDKFLWKHFENPFGISYGLLAIDNNAIVGLRMFMRWEFREGAKILKSIRPVDTCTHPDYQGKGIFKRLTLTGLDNIKDEYDLIFNTPNENSRPGYIKMGWKESDKSHQYRLGIINLFTKKYNFKNISSNFLKSSANVDKFSTNSTNQYYQWRYSSDSYKIAEFDDGGILIYKCTYLKGFKTLLLFEIKGAKVNFSAYLSSVCLKNNIIFVYYLNSKINNNLGIGLSISRGSQIVVYKDDDRNIFDRINFNLGDLEGIL